MNDDYWIAPVCIIILGVFATCYALGYLNGETFGRNQGIIYCMEQPEKCKIEFQYLKLTEKQNER